MAIYFLQDDDWSCDGVTGRRFFEFPFAFFRPSTEKHVSLIDDIKDVQFRDLDDPWILSFSYKGFDFFADSHSHGTTTTFIVVQIECPDEILLQIIGLFVEPMKISAYYEPTHPGLIESPASGNRRNHLIRWCIRIVAFIFFCIAINCFINGDSENAVGFGSGTIFLLVVSFCVDFAPSNTY